MPATTSANGSSSSVLPAELLADGRVIGAKVRVLTQAAEAFEGVIFTIDPIASFLILGELSCAAHTCLKGVIAIELIR
jgi:hypothetical protein